MNDNNTASKACTKLLLLLKWRMKTLPGPGAATVRASGILLHTHGILLPRPSTHCHGVSPRHGKKNKHNGCTHTALLYVFMYVGVPVMNRKPFSGQRD